MEYGKTTRITVEVANADKINISVDALKRVMRCANIADIATLSGVMSILEGVRRNYFQGRDATDHPVVIGTHFVDSKTPINCPFCGAEADVDCGNGDVYIAYCTQEDCIGHIIQTNTEYATRKDAVDAWNIRTNQSFDTIRLQGYLEMIMLTWCEDGRPPPEQCAMKMYDIAKSALSEVCK